MKFRLLLIFAKLKLLCLKKGIEAENEVDVALYHEKNNFCFIFLKGGKIEGVEINGK